jgi:hypothetical protein
VAVVVAGVLACGGCRMGAAAGRPAPTPISVPVPHSPATASTGGTYQGTCHYGRVLSARVIVHSTGNVGQDLRVSVTWPQAHHAPASATSRVRLAAGGSAAVDLRTRATGLAPGIVTGCVYRVIVVGTFGQAQGK